MLAQRVSRAQVTVAGEIIGQIDRGLVLLVGVTHADTETEAAFLANKVANLRVFEDDEGQMNRSLLDLVASNPIAAGALVVSQFTLYADARKGRRPSFTDAAPPALAEPLIERFAAVLRSLGVHVETGRFGAKMAVEFVNDGPVTIWLDTRDLRA